MAAHPEIASLEFLIGTWEGTGVGVYPTIDDFAYREEISFVAPPDKPFLHYSQKTWRAGDHPEAGTPLHAECGYVRPVEGGGAELVIAQPSGIVEVHSGTVTGQTISFASDLVAQTRTAKEVTSVDRRIAVDGESLTYEMWMGAVGEPHQIHLKATLRRTAGG
ncbi:MAG: FABP family protein [Actinomycetota bacterium]